MYMGNLVTHSSSVLKFEVQATSISWDTGSSTHQGLPIYQVWSAISTSWDVLFTSKASHPHTRTYIHIPTPPPSWARYKPEGRPWMRLLAQLQIKYSLLPKGLSLTSMKYTGNLMYQYIRQPLISHQTLIYNKPYAMLSSACTVLWSFD